MTRQGSVGDFGKNLKKVRESLGMSAAELAQYSGLTPGCISHIEVGSRDPSLSTIIRILSVIPVKFEVLIGFSPLGERIDMDKTL